MFSARKGYFSTLNFAPRVTHRSAIAEQTPYEVTLARQAYQLLATLSIYEPNIGRIIGSIFFPAHYPGLPRGPGEVPGPGVQPECLGVQHLSTRA